MIDLNPEELMKHEGIAKASDYAMENVGESLSDEGLHGIYSGDYGESDLVYVPEQYEALMEATRSKGDAGYDPYSDGDAIVDAKGMLLYVFRAIVYSNGLESELRSHAPELRESHVAIIESLYNDNFPYASKYRKEISDAVKKLRAAKKKKGKKGSVAGNPGDANFNDAFAKWFGDSKVLDGKGQPLVVYHGTPDMRGILEHGFKGYSRGSVFFATDSQRTAETYASGKQAWDYQNSEPGVIPLYLSIQNPLLIDAQGENWRGTEKFVTMAKENGHDGIVIYNSVDDYNKSKKSKPATVFAWFKPEQAKSAINGQMVSRIDRKPIKGATGNKGTWDAKDPILTNPSEIVLVVKAKEPNKYDVFVNHLWMGQVSRKESGTVDGLTEIPKRHHREIKSQMMRMKE
jgi:hypothetical protein